MSRFRLCPTPTQEAALARHCADARFVWNLALEQRRYYRLRLRPSPGYAEQNRQLTEARAEFPWLAEGSAMIQQQALRDLDQAFRNFFSRSHCFPTWRRKDYDEGFRVVAVHEQHVRRLNRHNGAVYVPKVGWVRFRWSRDPRPAKSYRVTRDPAGRWHVAFAVVPPPVEEPGTGEVVGFDRGITVSVMTSDGESFHAPTLRPKEAERLLGLQRELARAQPGSNRRYRIKRAIARLRTRETDRRKDWVEQTTTRLSRRYDVIKAEALNVRAMTRSAQGTREAPGRNVQAKRGLNRAILAQGWSLFLRRLEQKAPGRVKYVYAPSTSQRCSECGHISPESRESQAVFRCVACGFASNADLNAARNIAAGHAVTARGDRISKRRSVNREPQLCLLSA